MVTTDQINAIVAVIILIVAAISGGTLNLSPEQVNTLIVTTLAIIGAVTAYLQNVQKKTVIAAYTPGTLESETPAVIAQLPKRSWKMNEETKWWCTVDATPENKVKILQQIKEAEAQYLTHYQIQFSGGFYIIDYGLLMGGSGNPSGLKTN